MLSSGLFGLLLIWGVWIIVPIVVDGCQALARLALAGSSGLRRAIRRQPAREGLCQPTISIIIPAYNEELVIERCVNSIKAQTYPHHLVEIFVVDDGSTDRTIEIVNGHMTGNGCGHVRMNGQTYPVGEFSGSLRLIENSHMGKARSVNTGIRQAAGDIIICIDSDVVMAPDAVESIVQAFQRDPELGAATARLEIDPTLLLARDSQGRPILNARGEPAPRRLAWAEEFLARCEFFEYLDAFQLGRQAEASTGTMFTLAGACSIFRREALAKTSLYSALTVSEDTDLTFCLRQAGVRIGYVPDVKLYLEPTASWDELFAQRVRWQRGQLEVCSLHSDMMGNRRYGLFGLWTLPFRLQGDHTLSFPRLVWTILLPLFPLLGYPVFTVFWAIMIMYLFYALVEYLQIGVAYLPVDGTRQRIREALPWGVLLPLYRFLTLYFRMSGALITLMEPPTWRTLGPLERLSEGARELGQATRGVVMSMIRALPLGFLSAGGED